jgi:hypothetical protein
MKTTFRDYVELMTMTFIIIGAISGLGYAIFLEIGINLWSIVVLIVYIIVGLYGIVRLNRL